MIIFHVDFIVLSFMQENNLILETASECDKKKLRCVFVSLKCSDFNATSQSEQREQVLLRCVGD